MVWLLTAGIRTGFGAMVGTASGVYATDEGRIDVDRVARDLKRAGADEATVDKYRGYYERVRDDPAAARGRRPGDGQRPGGAAAASPGRRGGAAGAWWSLAGVLDLAGDGHRRLAGRLGELLQPVPILGVRRSRGGGTGRPEDPSC